MKLSEILKKSAYLATGTANVLHASYHLYFGLIAASHAHHGEMSNLAEKLESAMHHPVGQIAAASFVPLMAYDLYKHKRQEKQIKNYQEELAEKEKTIRGYEEILKCPMSKDNYKNQNNLER